MRLANLGVHRTGIDSTVMIFWNGVVFAIRRLGAFVSVSVSVSVSGMVRLLPLGDKMHPAFRTFSRMVLSHLRVHRADVCGCL